MMILQWFRSKWFPQDRVCTEAGDEESESNKLIRETESTIDSWRKTNQRFTEEAARSAPSDIRRVMLHARDRVTVP
jgi:hypothetical protein